MSQVSYTALTPLSFLERSARVWPDKVAVIYGSQRLSYSEFAAEVAGTARALQASGIEPGDRVAYLMPNLPQLLIAHFAVPLAGGVLVAVNTRLAANLDSREADVSPLLGLRAGSRGHPRWSQGCAARARR